MHGYNFTERVRKVLAMAREEAARLRHEYVGTEHILLGLIREGEGIAIVVLQNLKIEPRSAQQRLERILERGKSAQTTGPDLPYTSRAKKVLELAMQESRDLSHGYVGTEHLLLGVLREEKGIAAQVLRELGAELDAFRQETERLVGRPSDATAQAGRVSASRSGTAGACRPVRFTLTVDCEDGAWFAERFERATDAIAYLEALDPDR